MTSASSLEMPSLLFMEETQKTRRRIFLCFGAEFAWTLGHVSVIAVWTARHTGTRHRFPRSGPRPRREVRRATSWTLRSEPRAEGCCPWSGRPANVPGCGEQSWADGRAPGLRGGVVPIGWHGRGHAVASWRGCGHAAAGTAGPQVPAAGGVAEIKLRPEFAECDRVKRRPPGWP